MGDSETAARLLRRAKALRATPDIAWILSKITGAETTDAQPTDRDASRLADPRSILFR